MFVTVSLGQTSGLLLKRWNAFRWLGRLFLPRLFDGEHIFEIEELGSGQVRVSHGETFRGVLVLPLWKKLNTETRHGFEAMNAALKRRAEA